MDRIQKCFVTALGIAEADVTDRVTYMSIQQWDSMGHMALVSEIEAEFDIMLDTDDILALSSVAEARRIVEKCGTQCS